jgi:futalosine hydrolase
MNVLVVAATEFEIQPFIKSSDNFQVLITGIGIAPTIFHLGRRLSENKYDLVIQAGIAGTFKPAFEHGSVALVVADTFADTGIEEKGKFKTLFEAGLAKGDEFPYTGGWLVNNSDAIKKISLPAAKAVTVNKIVEVDLADNLINNKFNADIESMEGAAFHYVCLQYGVQFLQLRSVSNMVGERDKEKWTIPEAIRNLNTELIKTVTTFSTL